ncbi:uncharacterized protein PHALS_10835 [Plasmopara halstedii]|uniref:Uncharacterized protein n=1 Tax=Plasmopara halstedii TaxID=4781 RepID=A0A0P1AI30_PLAHL|nr:uncharacterized protein PHALS_10835 [Plasmopara halstedii]CEG40649.1 hypothetical protein PHALS_10835 [Plasmopara halstedii]|eukprot:XP_024577018.1 hypothetical protein PHALS_10835 [Plasmopara halstedii]
MPGTEAVPTIVPAPLQKRAPPPPPPTSTSASEPTSVPEPISEPELKQHRDVESTHAEPVHAATGRPPKKRKHRGLMRAIGGFFRRNCSDADSDTRPHDSESSQRRTSRWSHSHRQSMPEAPSTVVVQEILETTRSQNAAENEPLTKSPHTEEPPVKKVKKDKPKKAKNTPSPTEQSPTETSEMLSATLVDELGVELQRVSFLFFGGSDVDCTFQPELRPSELDDLHENDIRPSLQAKMPLFLPPPLPKNVRRSSILPDPEEYEF